MTLDAVDLAGLYRAHLAAAGRRGKEPGDWDRRAGELAREVVGSRYAEAFVSRMDLTGASTLLDVGCGPGTIALPLAPRLSRVYGLDYSQAMLDTLAANAAGRGLGNVVPILRAIEDDWTGVPACDLVVASRSTLVEDLAGTLARLDAWARLRVYVTSLVGGRFVDPAVLEAIGRDQPPLPDYIYTVNLLHRMGRRPHLDYIEGDPRPTVSRDFESYARRVSFSVGDLTPAEREKLSAWFEADPARALEGRPPLTWAFVWWETAR